MPELKNYDPTLGLPSEENGEKKKVYEVIQSPTLEALLDFEKLSWPEEEQATPEDLEKRLKAFPEGIFMLLVDGEPVAQFTMAPKNIEDIYEVDGFEKMRDLPVDRVSKTLWATNLSCNPNKKGGGYASEIVTVALKWASSNGYQALLAGVTCDDFDTLLKSGEVKDIQDYMDQGKNRALRTFQRAAEKLSQRIDARVGVFNSDPIDDYWTLDKISHGFGVLVELDLPNQKFSNGFDFMPSLMILDRMSKEHYLNLIDQNYADLPEKIRLHFSNLACNLYEQYYAHRYDNYETLKRLHNDAQRTLEISEDKINNYEEKNNSLNIYDDEEHFRIFSEFDAVFQKYLLFHRLEVIAKIRFELSEPEAEYSMDLTATNFLGSERRQTINEIEQTTFVTLPIRGCKMNCDFCSPKHLQSPGCKISSGASEQAISDLNIILSKDKTANTLKLFNGGNILWGTEFGESAGALHEHFWELLPQILINFPELKAVEIEVRTDEFTDEIANPEIQSSERKKIVVDRFLRLNEDLKAIGKELRVLLAIEYDHVSGQKGVLNKGIESAAVAVDFMKKHQIPWLGYAMFGGRYKEQEIPQERLIESVSNCLKFTTENDGRELIVNCQYLDPINQWEEKKDGIKYFMPKRTDIEALIKEIYTKGLLHGESRIRISLDKEELIKGTLGPEDFDKTIDADFKALINDFNNAEDQRDFVEKSILR